MSITIGTQYRDSCFYSVSACKWRCPYEKYKDECMERYECIVWGLVVATQCCGRGGGEGMADWWGCFWRTGGGVLRVSSRAVKEVTYNPFSSPSWHFTCYPFPPHPLFCPFEGSQVTIELYLPTRLLSAIGLFPHICASLTHSFLIVPALRLNPEYGSKYLSNYFVGLKLYSEL